MEILTIEKELLEVLQLRAQQTERLRINFDLRNSEDDGSQRMLNALMPGTVVAVHRHLYSSETVICISGVMDEVFYDDRGVEINRVRLNPLESKYGVQIPKGVWHAIETIEPTVIFESKDGRYGEDGSEYFQV